MIRNLFSRLSLVRRFTLVSALVTVGIALALIIGIEQRLENNALLQEANSAADQVALILNPNLWSADFNGALPPQVFSKIDALIRKDVLHNHIVHVKIYSRDGTVLYADEANLVGQKFPVSDELAAALSGSVGMDVTDLSKPENVSERGGPYTHLLEVYVPIHPVDAPDTVVGAYEIYHDLSIVQPFIDDMRRFVAVSVGLGFLILFVILYLLVRNASHELVVRNEENAQLYRETKQQLLDLQRSEERSQRRYQRLLALRAIDEAISASLDLNLTLHIFLDQATTQLQVDAADILLVNPATGLLTFASGRGFRGDAMRSLKVKPGEGYAGRVALERKMLHIPNLAVGGNATPSAWTAEDFRTYYGLPLITKGRLLGILEIFHRSALDPDRDWLEFLEGLAEQASIAIGDAELFENLQHSNDLLSRAYDATIEGWSHALDLRDRETEGHTRRVTEMTVDLAAAFEIEPAELVNIRRGALLHDIGKMGIPDEILLKAGPLTDPEWATMRKHPVYAYEMLSPIDYLRPALDIPYAHHERWDGSGYPRGLKGEQIPFSSRLFAVVDVWDALTTDRTYRRRWTEQKAREYILQQKGIQFDSKVVDMFFKMLDERRPASD